VQRNSGDAVEPTLNEHAPRHQETEGEHRAGVVERRVVRPAENRRDVAQFAVDDPRSRPITVGKSTSRAR
jgi:hypothetical protein